MCHNKPHCDQHGSLQGVAHCCVQGHSEGKTLNHHRGLHNVQDLDNIQEDCQGAQRFLGTPHCQKAKNKTSPGFARLHPIETTILQNWELLREEEAKKHVGKQATQDEFLAHVKKEGLLDEMQEKQVRVKREIKEEMPIKKEGSQELPVKNELPVKKEEPQDTPQQGQMQEGPQYNLISTNAFKKVALVYFVQKGKVGEVALEPGPDGFYICRPDPGQILPTTLVCDTIGRVAAEPPALTEPHVDDVTPAIAGQPSAIGPDDEDGACAGEEGKVIHIESDNEDAEEDVEMVDNRVSFTPFMVCIHHVSGVWFPMGGGHHVQTPVQSSGDWVPLVRAQLSACSNT